MIGQFTTRGDGEAELGVYNLGEGWLSPLPIGFEILSKKWPIKHQKRIQWDDQT